MERSVLRQNERFQLSYELPHEAYTSHVYPRQSSNGSTVIIYGHERGLRLVWYGGRSFKPPRQHAPPAKVNGAAKSDAMVIDLDDDDDDEEPAAKHEQVPPAEFEEYEDEVDPSAPYGDVLRYIDIPLGTAVLRLATPHVPKDVAQAPTGSWPSIFLDRIVVAVASPDSAIHVISAPLDPPSPEVKDVSKLDIQTYRIFGPNSHPDFISDIAITHTKAVPDDTEDEAQLRPKTEQSSTDPDAAGWLLLVASVSCTGSGLLLVHQIPLQSDNRLPAKTKRAHPIRRQYLPFSAMSAKLAFNTCPYPAERHSTLLITLPAASCVKLYQIFPTYTRERRGSTATIDTVSSNRSARSAVGGRGKFLITFLPSFNQDDDEILVPRRKRVLDAQWIAGGRAVIALLEDGEWGIWDLEAVGPTSNSAGSNLIRGQGNISGIQGGSLTAFATRSNIFQTAERKQKPINAGTQPATGSLVPMTPSTRKTRSESLFHGQPGTDNSKVARPSSQPGRGSICVEDRLSNRGRDESVMINYADGIVYMPSILSFWKSEAKPTRLPAVRYGGQQLRSIGLVPKSDNTDNSDSPGLFGLASSIPNFLVQTDHRLILSLNPLPEVSTSDAATQTPADPAPQTTYQALLAVGDLDVDGMDRILEDMGAADASKPRPMNLFTRSVGFRIDEDVDMGSPTPSKYPRRMLGNGLTAQASQRRVFT
ncbi:hypothetical protein A1O1_03067 [Capronia coronata CBS 617.96]|uniref:Nucleoporin NUP37 n=1 Tax=Capronia coronata CBS 617.96 TaxID=1182541 RepID=W9YY93_9EURO|nr:uncharacterized protein A1O1_03067 [Capronia coronata CBS 617.96]EXJ94670.1 hypothetical protein A1O1_03067 [Capronia coronata CBS 617.96]